uniref:Uncharacterized protein n=1 Tax=Anguilla anguilla TaxID=7936 RepID=A0A0E9SDA3_ANGAN
MQPAVRALIPASQKLLSTHESFFAKKMNILHNLTRSPFEGTS